MPDDQLPPDPDVDVSDPVPVMRPVHLRWRFIGLVALGGAIGTLLRDIISGAFPADGGVSWSIFWINITGALLLGMLLEALAHRGPDEGRRRTLRLLLGTGVMGGFTTYSTLAESTAALFLDGRGLAGTGYALLTVLAGAIATGLGLVVAGLFRPKGARA
jgi:CrcB protein